MALRTPIILISGGYSQLPTGDTVPGTDAAALASGNAALVDVATAQASGNAALVVGVQGVSDAETAQASGNAALVDSVNALSSGNLALSEVQQKNYIQTVSHTASSLAAGASSDFTVAAGNVFNLLEVTSSHPAWIRVYSSDAARSADTRTTPGNPYPSTGSGFYAEILTSNTPETVLMSPIAVCQGSGNVAFVRKRNETAGAVNLQTDFKVLTVLSGVA
jgi:hypothetical protein